MKFYSKWLLAGLGCFFSCTQPPPKRIKELAWLVGTWENKSQQNNAVEIWHYKNDSTLVGIGFQLVQGDTAFQENLEIRERADKIFFRTGIPQQEETDFELDSKSLDTLVFVNVSHDFPTEIRYTRINADSILAKISGTVDDEAREIFFPMSKRKN